MRHFAVGEALMTQGEASVSIHFVLEGQVRVTRQRRSDAQPVQLAMHGSGEIVGEMGVMVDLPRSATVIAATPTTTLELDTASFEARRARVPDPPPRPREAVERAAPPNVGARRRRARGLGT